MRFNFVAVGDSGMRDVGIDAVISADGTQLDFSKVLLDGNSSYDVAHLLKVDVPWYRCEVVPEKCTTTAGGQQHAQIFYPNIEHMPEMSPRSSRLVHASKLLWSASTPFSCLLRAAAV